MSNEIVVQSASRSSDPAKSKPGVSIGASVGIGTVRSDLSFDISSIYRLRIQRGRCLFVRPSVPWPCVPILLIYPCLAVSRLFVSIRVLPVITDRSP